MADKLTRRRFFTDVLFVSGGLMAAGLMAAQARPDSVSQAFEVRNASADHVIAALRKLHPRVRFQHTPSSHVFTATGTDQEIFEIRSQVAALDVTPIVRRPNGETPRPPRTYPHPGKVQVSPPVPGEVCPPAQR